MMIAIPFHHRRTNLFAKFAHNAMQTRQSCGDCQSDYGTQIGAAMGGDRMSVLRLIPPPQRGLALQSISASPPGDRR
jgi:hypothetical protein